MAEELQLALLGNPGVRRDGVPVTGLSSGKHLALLCYLAVTGRPHLRPTLAGLLWGNMPDASARNNLSKALTHLRHAVGRNLRITRQEVAFSQEIPYWLDVQVFEKDASARSDVDQLQRAVELYRGDFLEGFYVHQAPAFEEWVLAQRARLRELALQALYTLAVHHARRGTAGHAAATAYTTHLLTLEPWREEAHRQLMLLLARSGQRGAALAQYEACRQVMADELGVEPGAETTALYERIRDGAVGPVRPLAPLHNLPAPITPLVGREALLTEITARLKDPDCRLLTLVGPGGCGKTRLALAAAARQVGSFAQGVFLVSLAPLGSVDAIAPAVAEAVGLSRTGHEPQRQLLDYLRHRQMLVILDNYEHLLAPPDPGQRDGAHFVTEVLRAAPDVKVLATSRVRLNVQGEQRFHIAGMAFPEQEASWDALQYDAVRLFIQSARRGQPDFAPQAEDLRHVVRICRLVGGIPLAILLAATWTEMLTVEEIANEIAAQSPGHSLDFLVTDARDVPERQRSMRAVFAHSWSLLSEREQAVFAGLSVFRGGFTRQAVEQVTGASLRQLRLFVDRSLLQRTPTGRYEIHELLRQYAEERLDRSPDAGSAVRDRHCATYASALQQWAADLKGPRQPETLAALEADLGNARVAWDWAIECGQVERLDQAIECLGLFYDWQFRFPEGEAAFREAAERLPSTARQLPDRGLRVLAKALAWQARFACYRSRHQLARQLLEKGLALLDDPRLAEHDTRAEKALIFWAMGWQAAGEKAKWLFERCLELHRSLGNRWWVAELLCLLGLHARRIVRYDESIHWLQESADLYRTLDHQRGIAAARRWLGFIYALRGQAREAERPARENLAVARRRGNQLAIGAELMWLGVTLIVLGKYAEAHSLLEEGEAILSELGVRLGTCEHIAHVGVAKVHLGRYEKARAYGPVAHTREFGIPPIVPHFVVVGSVALAGGAYPEAHRWLQEGVAVYRESQIRGGHSHILSISAYAARGIGDDYQAQQALCEAMQTAAEVQDVHALSFALPAMALLLVDRGQVERAVELYALASRCPVVANSRWFEDVAGRYTAAAAASLPPDGLAAAQERGRARDLWDTAAELLKELREAMGSADKGTFPQAKSKAR